MALTLLEMRNQFQDPMRQGIVDLLWQSSRIMQYISFIEFKGTAYPYATRKSLPGVGFRSLNSTFNRTSGVINPAVENLVILGGAIRTDSIATLTKGPQARTNEITAQIEATGKFFDKNFLNGDPSTNPMAFYGLKARLRNNQLLTNATNGGPVLFGNVVQLLDQVEGDDANKILFMNRTTRRNLSADVVANAKGSQVMDVGGQLKEFQGAKIVEVFYDETESPILDFVETCGSSTQCTSIYCVHFGGTVDEQGLQGITGLDQKIMTSGPYDYGEYLEDIIQMLAGIGLFSGYCAARLQGITATPAVALGAARPLPKAPPEPQDPDDDGDEAKGKKGEKAGAGK